MSELNNVKEEKGGYDLRKYYTTMPNLIDDMSLSVYAHRLYCHLKRVAGDDGECWQSTTTLAKACKMSTGKIVYARQELVTAGLIAIERTPNPNGGSPYMTITIKDIWDENFKKYTRSSDELEHVHHMNVTGSPHEPTGSPHETKNNTIKNNPYIYAQKKQTENQEQQMRESSQTEDPVHQDHTSKTPVIKDIQNDKQKTNTVFPLPAKQVDKVNEPPAREINHTQSKIDVSMFAVQVRPLAEAFCDEFRFGPSNNGDVRFWSKTFREYIKLGVTPEMIHLAFKLMREDRLYNFKNPESIRARLLRIITERQDEQQAQQEKAQEKVARQVLEESMPVFVSQAYRPDGSVYFVSMKGSTVIATSETDPRINA